MSKPESEEEKKKILLNAAVDKHMSETCSLCGGKARLEEVESTCCKCGAEVHYKKTCLACGFVSFVHRHLVPSEETEDSENSFAA